MSLLVDIVEDIAEDIGRFDAVLVELWKRYWSFWIDR